MNDVLATKYGSTNGVVRFSKLGRVGVIRIDSPPVNALSHGVRKGLVDGLVAGLSDPAVHAMVVVGQGRTFTAGADIREFGAAPEQPTLDEVIARFEASDKPVVAALHGTTFGGGLELALGCHYRVAARDAKCGLPEVKLGLLPGAGGTQRLPRLIGVPKALELIVKGDPVAAADSKACGLVDLVVEDGDLVEVAAAFADRVAKERPLPRVRDLTARLDEARRTPELFETTRSTTKARARGAQAPLRCIDAVKAAVDLPFEEGLQRERRLFVEALASTEFAALRHVFFAERLASKVPDVPSDTPTIPIRRAAILGAGTMGTGIAMACASAGLHVTLIDRERGLVEKGLQAIMKNYAATVSKGRLSQAEMDQCVGRVAASVNGESFANADLVIEAVFEEMDLKKQVFASLDQKCRKDAILATNTSTLDVNVIAEATSRPEQVIGLHFFSPANVMRLLEIVRGAKTSKSVVATSMKLAKDIGKVGVLVGVCNGFVANRMLYAYGREADFLVQDGALPQQVDEALTRFGFAMGPFAMNDLAGIDVGWRIRKAYPKPPAGARYAGAVADRLAEMGRFGQKTRAGYYRYETGSRSPMPDPVVEAVVVSVSEELGIVRRTVTDDEVRDRCILAMVNEGARILNEGIAMRASDIDTIWINGFGFPAYRGGPMFYADTLGLSRVLERLRSYVGSLGAAWEPSPLLQRIATQGQTFASLDAMRAGMAARES
jgi:3-hydroxyacyl-CoA dehydrogenase